MSTRNKMWIAASIAVAGSCGRAQAQCLDWRAFPGSGAGGSGLNAVVRGLCAWDDGSGSALYAIGQFTLAGGVAAQHVARWNGSGWTALPLVSSSINDPTYRTLATFDSGSGSGPELYAGGRFLLGPNYAFSIARWSAGAWQPLASGLGGSADTVHTFLQADLGAGPRLFVGGSFTTVGPWIPSPNVASWDGTSWSGMGIGVNGAVLAFEMFGAGPAAMLHVAGTFTHAGGLLSPRIARWNGTGWHALGGLNGTANALAVFDDGDGPALYIGGSFTNAGGIPVSCVARWTGTAYTALGAGLNGQVLDLGVFDDGSGPHLYAAGSFTASGTTPILHVARWNDTSWEPVGNGVDGAVWSLLSHDDGSGPQLFAGGQFQTAATFATSNLAAWRGCTGPIASFCFGDGTSATCPCRNHGLAGHGCNNAFDTGGARLDASGTTNPDALRLDVVGEPPNAATPIFQGSAILSAAIRFGDGLRCAGGSIGRLYTAVAANGAVSVPGAGEPSISARSAALGDVLVPGSVRAYQAWYRDADPAFCVQPLGGTWNLSNAVRVVW